ncbi:MAG TPA: hypothetical protein VFR21_25955 [Bradyrhizobium sp.]|nr:hypothetical protein [Bradyrhizobium sp.]
MSTGLRTPAAADHRRRDIKSTLRYAHVLYEDVASAVEAIASSGLPNVKRANVSVVLLTLKSGYKVPEVCCANPQPALDAIVPDHAVSCWRKAEIAA